MAIKINQFTVNSHRWAHAHPTLPRHSESWDMQKFDESWGRVEVGLDMSSAGCCVATSTYIY